MSPESNVRVHFDYTIFEGGDSSEFHEALLFITPEANLLKEELQYLGCEKYGDLSIAVHNNRRDLFELLHLIFSDSIFPQIIHGEKASDTHVDQNGDILWDFECYFKRMELESGEILPPEAITIIIKLQMISEVPFNFWDGLQEISDNVAEKISREILKREGVTDLEVDQKLELIQ